MARIVLDIEPKTHKECPFSKRRGGCIKEIVCCRCIDMNDFVEDEYDKERPKDIDYPIDFKRCPYCTTFVREYTDVLMEGEI